MALRAGRRTAEQTHVQPSNALALRRLGVGAALLGAGAALGALVGGWAWALGALLMIPGATTLAAARHRFTAPCPGCGSELGGAVFVGPDEPVIATGALDHRCAACGIYVDVSRGVVREVPFGRESELPSYSATLPAAKLPALAWGDRCVACGEPATVGASLLTRAMGHLIDDSPAREGGEIPLCATHGATAEGRGILVARSAEVVSVQFASYASYRGFLDANRSALDLRVREASREE